MTFWRKLLNLLPWVRRAQARDIDEELQALEAIAGRQALGNVALAAEDARAAYAWRWLEHLAQDLRYAVRSMRHNPLFTALVVLSFGLGIGANTTIFSFTESILLRALPVPQADELVVMKWRGQNYSLASRGMSWSTSGSYQDEASGVTSSVFPHPALRVFEESDDVLSGALGYFALDRLDVTTATATDSAKGHYVTGNYFHVMRIAPASGRLLQPADEAPGAGPVAVLSHEFSLRRFGSSADAVGQTMRVNDTPVVIVGVAPSGFFGAEPGSTVDFYLPLTALVETSSWTTSSLESPNFYWLDVMGRLQPGVDIVQAEAALASRFRQFAVSTVTNERQRDDIPVLHLEAGAAGLDGLRRQYSQPVLVLTVMVGLILLIACANVANLLLARAASRRREIAIRLGMGAGRARLIRQLLTESMLLAAMGGVAGVAMAWWGIDVIASLLGGGRDHFTLHAELNGRVLGVTAVLAMATGIVFGLVPALQATRVDIVPALKDARPREMTVLPRVRAGSLLVAAQVSLSLVLLVAAGLFGRTLMNLHAIEVGFNRDSMLLFGVRPGAVGYSDDALMPLFEELRERLSGLPGVVDVSLSNRPLPMGGGSTIPVGLDGELPPPTVADPSRPPNTVRATVGPDFFRTMQMSLVNGRDFTAQDRAGSLPVAIVNQRFAGLFGLNDVTGRTVSVFDDRLEVVAVVDDALAFTLKGELWPIIYLPYLQADRPPSSMTYEVRAAGNALALAGSVRDLVRQIDSRLAVHDLKTQAAHVDETISREVTLARLGSFLAALALVIACVGLYGTVAFAVARRTSEIGIRMALGASTARIVRMVLGNVLLLAGVGLVVGLGLSLVASRYVSTLLYGIEPTDPVTILASTSVLLVCGVAAAFVPALRAARIDPMLAVRRD